MSQEIKSEKKGRVKKFFSRWFQKLDKKMEEKAKSSGCCCDNTKSEGRSCCS